MNQPLNERVNETARQYLSHNGGQFRHAGVSLPLDVAVLTIAIQSQIVGSLLTEYGGELGNARALIFIDAMFTAGKLNDWGKDVLDGMLTCFCDDVRDMLDAGQDPAEVLRGRVGGGQ